MRALRSPLCGLLRLSAVFIILVVVGSAMGQEAAVPEGTPLPDYAQRIKLPQRSDPPSVTLSDNGLPHILITGYWPPTNEMLREFSQGPDHNPDGWVGENWENRGYNIYAFFPEFPDGFGKGEGDFEVDYQDTSYDWWPLVEEIQPIAVVTFSRAGNDFDWEMEGGNGNYVSTLWTDDYLDPREPTPDLPSDQEPPPNDRYSSQPMDEIVAAVSLKVPTLNAFIAPFDHSRFLSNYIGYHGNWWHDLHTDPCGPGWNICAGHVHVGYAMSLEEAIAATRVTLRTVIEHIDKRRVRVDFDGDGDVDGNDYKVFWNCMAGPDAEPNPTYFGVEVDDCLAAFDSDCDADVDLGDFRAFVSPALSP